MKHATLLLQLAVIIFVVAFVLRVKGYNDTKGLPVIGTTPGAFHRVCDTFLLGSIALSLIDINRVLRNKDKSIETPSND